MYRTLIDYRSPSESKAAIQEFQLGGCPLHRRRLSLGLDPAFSQDDVLTVDRIPQNNHLFVRCTPDLDGENRGFFVNGEWTIDCLAENATDILLRLTRESFPEE
jgi:hypothetical protein